MDSISQYEKSERKAETCAVTEKGVAKKTLPVVVLVGSTEKYPFVIKIASVRATVGSTAKDLKIVVI